MRLLDITPGTGAMARAVQICLLVLAVCAILYFGKALFVPLSMGLLVAIVMFPLCKKLEKAGLPKAAAIGLVLGFVVLLFLALMGLMWYQLQYFTSDLPALRQKILTKLPAIQNWLFTRFSIETGDPEHWIRDIITGNPGKIGSGLLAFLNAAAGIGFTLFLVPVWAALFLYNRGSFVLFLRELAGKAHEATADQVLEQTVYTYYNYIRGVAQVYLAVGILNSIGLLALGIEHAILFGMLTAIMTIIPYLGIIVSALLPVTVAFLTRDSLLYPLGVIGVFSFVQYLEANVIFPKLVGLKLNVSTSVTLAGIIVGGILWGVSGMILFIPFVAVVKIISDHSPRLKALNMLLKA